MNNGFDQYLSQGYVLFFDDIDGGPTDTVEIEINRVLDSPLYGYAQPVGVSYGQFWGLTQGGVSIDPGADISFENRQLSTTPTNALLKDVKAVIKTRLVFNGDYGVVDKFALPGQKINNRKYFSSKGVLTETSVLGIHYNPFKPNELAVYYFFRSVKLPAIINITQFHEAVEVQIPILKGYEYGSRTCFREDNDLGVRWLVNRFDPSIQQNEDGSPVVYRQTVPIPIEPLGLIMLPTN